MTSGKKRPTGGIVHADHGTQFTSWVFGEKISNGGYGGVNLALKHGVPLILSGATEDKAEVSRRVRWAGVGVTTRHHPPTPTDIRRALHRIVNDETIDEQAKKIAQQYANAGGVSGAVKIVEQLAMNG